MKKLRKYKVWVLQPYKPSKPIRDNSGKIRTPVGRVFFHFIYDGTKLQIVPLTAYQKLNGFRGEDPKDIHNPEKVTFGKLEDSAEYSKTELDVILAELSRYFAGNLDSIFELVEHGLDGSSYAAQNMRERYDSLKDYEKRALKAVIMRFGHTERLGQHVFALRSWNHDGYEYINGGVDVFENPIFNSLRRLDVAVTPYRSALDSCLKLLKLKQQ